MLRPRVTDRRWRRSFWILIGSLLVLIALFGTDAGVTWDEVLQREYGARIVAWFSSGFTDEAAMHYSNLYLYGGLFDAPAELIARISPLGAYETRHVLSALIGFVAILFAGLTARQIAGERAGLLAAIFLSLTPSWVGHSLFNPKDVPFGTAALLVVHASVLLCTAKQAFRWRDVLWSGAAIGIALGVRPGGIFIVAYPALAIAMRATLEIYRHRQSGNIPPAAAIAKTALLLFAKCALALAVLWLVMLATWPWAQLSPFERPIEAIRKASNFQWNFDVLFDGKQIHARELPRTYLLTWFRLTTPETYALAGLAGIVGTALTWKRTPKPEATRIAAALLPVVAVILPLTAAYVLRPVVYDGHRHFLFIFPPLAVIAGVALSSVLGSDHPRLFRILFSAAFVGLGAFVATDMIKLHPYEYIYVNRSSGSLSAVYERYETDYWGSSYRDGLQWVLANVKADSPTLAINQRMRPNTSPQSKRPLRIAGCYGNGSIRLQYYVDEWAVPKNEVEVVVDKKNADILIAPTRGNCHRVPGSVLHRVERMGVPLLFVVDVSRFRRSLPTD